MTVQHQHTKLPNAAAREMLRPLGVVQKGRSRTWLDDHGWWLGVIEFQPSSWSRGSYLNVGVNWLWDPKDHLSFDFGHRVDMPGEGEYIEHENEEQFSPLARKLAMVTAEQVRHYRDVFPTLEAAAAILSSDKPNPTTCFGHGTPVLRWVWPVMNGGTKHVQPLRGLVRVRGGIRVRTEVDEMRYRRARQLSDLVADRRGFSDQIRADVRKARALLKLDPDVELPL